MHTSLIDRQFVSTTVGRRSVLKRVKASRTILQLMALFAALSIVAAPSAQAREATVSLMPGTTVETLGSASADGWTTALVLVRLTLEPGAMIPDHTHPGTAVITVESGVLQTELVRGTAILSRKPANGAGSVPEAVERGTTLLLNPGDSISYDASAWKTIENSGAGSLTLLASMLVDADRPLISFVAPPRQFNPHLQ